jgi:glycosyltransferase involved in cell wall biosynthesis
MFDRTNPQVSVIIPAYNAGATIDETLFCVRSQTHTNLEIIVVDDGSADGTCDIVQKHAGQDPRILLLRQENGGVASARNRALTQASGQYLAPVDADDLWRPDKIAQQLARIEGRPGVSLVYTWYAAIDCESRIRSIVRSNVEGAVLPALCAQNFIGHASSPLMRTNDALRAGGYDISLRARRAQGSEDWALYLKLAELGDFAVIKSVLTGYRTTERNMSSDFVQMIRSTRLVLSEFASTHPEYREQLRRGELFTTLHYLKRALLASEIPGAAATFYKIYRADPRFAMDLLREVRWNDLRGALQIRKRFRPESPRPHFLSASIPDSAASTPQRPAFMNSEAQRINRVPARAE